MSASHPRLGGKGSQLLRLKDLGYATPRFMILESGKTVGRSEIDQIRLWMKESGAASFALRSSAVGEDGHDQSYAGIFETRLRVTEAILENELRAVLDSARNAVTQKYASTAPAMAVIVQEMLEPDFAGVAFSRNPRGASEVLRVEACRGLGTGVVDGNQDVTSYQITREGEVIVTDGEALLSDSQLQELRRQVLRIENDWQTPVDVEWAITSAGLFILQARPITQKFSALHYLTDANLSESYPAFTAPLSRDFARHIYAHVFRDTARLLGASPHRIRELWPYYQNLINEAGGHLYYNLESYAAALGALPKGEEQFKDWLNLIGHRAEVHIPRPSIRKTSLWELLKIVFRLLSLTLFQRVLTERFLKRSHERLAKMNAMTSAGLSAHQIFDRIREEFDEPQDLAMGIFNDYFLMRAKNKDQMTAPTLSLESVRPQQELARLAWHVDVGQRRAKLQSLLMHENISVLTWPGLRQIFRGFSPGFANDAAAFVETYGDRAFGDLKLEHLGFSEDPRSFLQLLLQTAPVQNDEAVAAVEFQPRDAYERALIYRESCRLLRTRYFAWFRRQFLELARAMRADGCPWVRPEHIFSLHWSELSAWRAGELTGPELIARSNHRFLEASPNADYPGFLVHDGDGEAALKFNLSSKRQNPDSNSQSGPPRGEVVSWPEGPEFIEGQIIFVEDPRHLPTDLVLADSILLTETTDPAWVYYLSQCRGLISKRGNALSHVAIIAREIKKPMLVKAKGDVGQIRNGERIRIWRDGRIEKFN